MPEVALEGCTPEPLMSYLKALGVLRLVAEQVDPDARLSWRGGVGALRSCLNRESLTNFFLEQYRPTPVVGPWGARSGFYPGSSERSAREALDAVVTAATELPRFTDFRDVITAMRALLARHGYVTKVRDEDKLTLMRICRNELPDRLLPWLDAVFILTDDSRKFPPLLGTGGNEGSGSYVSTFAQIVNSLLIERRSDGGVVNSLFGDFNSSLDGFAVGHFSPGAIGGANSSQGFDGGGGANAWDYLLAIEGSLLFAGAVARRMGIDTVGHAAYPFCVDAIAVGYASECDKEASDATRAELWLPLWTNPASFGELSQLFAEGRSQLGRRQARNAVEFALSLATLGVCRGVNAFVRYAFVMRNGWSYFAAPLGRVPVMLRPTARLLNDPPLVGWLDRLRNACRDKDKTPARYQSAIRQIDRAMFAFANRSEQGNDAKRLLDVLSALGRAERTLASGLAFCKDKYLRPLQGLSSQWLKQADDGSPEFRLAASLAGIRSTEDGKVGRLRTFLEEVEVTKFVNWSPGSTSAVWSRRPLAANLAAVFRRRQLEAYRNLHTGVPLNSPQHSSLPDIIRFLNEETDDERLHDLLWGLIGVEYRNIGAFLQPDRGEVEVPFEFGVPRLLVEELCVIRQGEYWNVSNMADANATPDPAVFDTLASGQCSAIQECVGRAARRLKSFGLLVNGYRNRQQSGKALHVVSSIPPERLLASMLFPLSERNLERIANSVLYPPETQE
jgi:CRISPR-associated protein Csx17